ncbi:MBL fold metallo-hydrolase [Granulicella tundricola]|uniref:Metallo-beta-lactamase family protein n=1 Tax=Granulicella tundricola (strain ATCC BAA-1859 / DSM 23138 / MP5ACTX9) TaxID=1198114 RepID=E8WYE4_GRATM|nr:MBL fold metallo-hydrolase [Granulicella tundricola]ADW69850.1 metallo-beta-lactamase family protein [Granulicella tundricola MP5ACTX9]
MTFLGSGTSMGVPTLGCPCAVCADARIPGSRNRRTRPSLRLEWEGHTVLIDTGPDFHAQAIRENISRVDAVFYTHHHADHILGMDDLRPLSFRNTTPLPLYADDPTADALERVFGYTFRTENRYPTSARVQIHRLDPTPGSTTRIFGANFQRIPVIHGRERITGYRFGSAAYLTDMSDIPPESLALLQGLDILILDALRPAPHPSHSHVAKSIAFVEQLKPKRAYFTHMGHELDHNATEATLPQGIHLAYDGLQLTFDIAPEETAS